MAYVINTMGAGVDYVGWEKVVDGKNIRLNKQWTISIKGGNGVIDKFSIFTPYNGVVSEVDEEELAKLRTCKLFLDHERDGFIQVVKSKSATEKAGRDMQREDDSAQLTPEDFAAEACNEDINANGVKIGVKLNPATVEKKTNATRSRKRK